MSYSFRCAVSAVLIFSSLSAAADQSLLDPPSGIFHNQYYSLYLSDAKCGWAHEQYIRSGQTITARMNMLMRLGRAGTTMEITQRSQTTETIDGKLLTFKSVNVLSGAETIHRGTVKDSQVTMTITHDQ